jgi:hypothetical protein
MRKCAYMAIADISFVHEWCHPEFASRVAPRLLPIASHPLYLCIFACRGVYHTAGMLYTCYSLLQGACCIHSPDIQRLSVQNPRHVKRRRDHLAKNRLNLDMYVCPRPAVLQSQPKMQPMWPLRSCLCIGGREGCVQHHARRLLVTCITWSTLASGSMRVRRAACTALSKSPRLVTVACASRLVTVACASSTSASCFALLGIARGTFACSVHLCFLQNPNGTVI